MNYLNLDSLFMDAAPFAGAETVDVGTWIRLLRYCAKTENGGRIPLETLRDPPSACETPVENPANPVENPANPVENSPPPVELLLKTGRLERILGITADQFNRFAPGLWEIEGDEIVVLGYPVDQEEKVRANRVNGRKGGRPRDDQKPHGKPPATPRAKRKERKGKEIETTTTTPPLIHPDDKDEYGPAPGSDYPDPHRRWSEFIEHRFAFERFDVFIERTKATTSPPDN